MPRILIGGLILFCSLTARLPTQSFAAHYLSQRSSRQNGVSKDLRALLGDLRRNGATAKLSTEKISEAYFSAPGRVVYVNDQSVWIFSYSSTTATDKDAAKISSDGMTIGTSKPSWLGTPHFYRRPRMIVLYLGDESRVIEVLKRTLGQQFAGG